MTVVIDAMGIGLIMPVTPDLIRELLGAELSEAAIWGGVLSSSFAVMQFLFGAAIGNLSDRYGRRPVLLLSLFVMAVDYVIMGLTQSIWVLLLGRLIGGVASATQSTAAAYMADISTPEEKSSNFGLLGAAFGIGFVLGPMMGGLLSEFGSRAPFYAAAVLATANLIFGYFIVPETVTDKIRRPLEWRRMNPFRALQYIGSLPGLGLLLIVYFIHQIAFFVYPTTWAYYTQEKFAWTAWDVGISLSCFGIGMAVVQGGIIRMIVPRLGEWRTMIFGMTIATVSYICFAGAWQGWMVYALMPVTCLGMVNNPALQSVTSKAVSDSEQGELQGVMTGVAAIASIMSPLVMTGLFGYFTAESAPIYLPAAPYYFAGILEAGALAVLVLAYMRHLKTLPA